MIYFKENKFPIESKENTEQLLNQSTSKILTFFDLTQTSAYIVPAGRVFAGQRLNTDEVLISRYRHAIFGFVPRIITKWKIESLNGKPYLVTRSRLGLVSCIGLVIISLPSIAQLIKSVIGLTLPDIDAMLFSIILLGGFFLLAKYEIRKTEMLIEKVINNERVKSTIAV